MMKSALLLAAVMTAGPLLAQTDHAPLWVRPTGWFVFSSPAIGDDGTLYIGAGDAKLYAITLNGELRWVFRTGAEIQSSPAIGKDGTIYFGSGDHKVYAVNPDGTESWEFVTGDYVLSSPALGADGTIYIGSRDGKYYALTPGGEKKWEYVTGQYYTDMPAVIGPEGTIYVSAGGKVVALKHNGETRWEYPINSFSTGVSVVVGKHGGVYATCGGFDMKLVALTHRGEKLWEFPFGNPLALVAPSFPAVGPDGTIYISVSDAYLYALTPDGALKWKVPTAPEQSSPALSDDGKIYINSAYDFRLLCFNTDGALQWDYFIGGTGSSGLIASFPTLYKDVLYFGCGNGNVYAFKVGGHLEKCVWPVFGRDAKHSGRDIQRDIQPRINSVTGAQELQFQIEPGIAYRLQGTADLVTWSDVASLNSSTNFLVIPRPAGAHNFYRLCTSEQ